MGVFTRISYQVKELSQIAVSTAWLHDHPHEARVADTRESDQKYQNLIDSLGDPKFRLEFDPGDDAFGLSAYTHRKLCIFFWSFFF